MKNSNLSNRLKKTFHPFDFKMTNEGDLWAKYLQTGTHQNTVVRFPSQFLENKYDDKVEEFRAYDPNMEMIRDASFFDIWENMGSPETEAFLLDLFVEEYVLYMMGMNDDIEVFKGDEGTIWDKKLIEQQAAEAA